MFEHEPLSAEYAQRVIDERCEKVRQKMIDECPREWRTYVISRVAAHRRKVAQEASQGGWRYRAVVAPSSPRHIGRGSPVVAASAIADIRASLKPNPNKEAHS